MQTGWKEEVILRHGFLGLVHSFLGRDLEKRAAIQMYENMRTKEKLSENPTF